MVNTIVLTVGSRRYELVAFHELGEGLVDAVAVIERAKTLNINTDEQDGELFLADQDTLPAELNGLTLIFIQKIPGEQPIIMTVFQKHNRRWTKRFRDLQGITTPVCRLVRRLGAVVIH